MQLNPEIEDKVNEPKCSNDIVSEAVDEKQRMFAITSFQGAEQRSHKGDNDRAKMLPLSNTPQKGK